MRKYMRSKTTPENEARRKVENRIFHPFLLIFNCILPFYMNESQYIDFTKKLCVSVHTPQNRFQSSQIKELVLQEEKSLFFRVRENALRALSRHRKKKIGFFCAARRKSAKPIEKAAKIRYNTCVPFGRKISRFGAFKEAENADLCSKPLCVFLRGR